MGIHPPCSIFSRDFVVVVAPSFVFKHKCHGDATLKALGVGTGLGGPGRHWSGWSCPEETAVSPALVARLGTPGSHFPASAPPAWQGLLGRCGRCPPFLPVPWSHTQVPFLLMKITSDICELNVNAFVLTRSTFKPWQCQFKVVPCGTTLSMRLF